MNKRKVQRMIEGQLRRVLADSKRLQRSTPEYSPYQAGLSLGVELSLDVMRRAFSGEEVRLGH